LARSPNQAERRGHASKAQSNAGLGALIRDTTRLWRRHGLMLWELSVAEPRYRAVLEVGGVFRDGGRRTVWSQPPKREYLAGALPAGRRRGLEERSHQVHHHPWRTPAEIEELVCELRRGQRNRASGCFRCAGAVSRVN
jgi:hypothetical protein